MAQALDEVGILDLSGGIAGPLGVLQLAQHGADVIKVEPPGGRPDRVSPASRVYNRSRRSITLDLKKPQGAARDTGCVVEVDDSDVGPTTQSGVTIFLDSTPGAVRGPQPPAGAQTDEVLRSVGHDDDELAELRAKGVI